MVAVIIVDAYPFLAFLDLALSRWGYRNGCFLVIVCRLTVEKLNGSSDQEAPPTAGKNAGTFLELYLLWKCLLTATNGGVDIPKVPFIPRVYFFTIYEFSMRVVKCFPEDKCLIHYQLTFLVVDQRFTEWNGYDYGQEALHHTIF